MTLKHRLWSLVWILVPLLLAQAHAATLTIGIVLPAGQLLQSGDAAEALRQSLLTQFKARSVEAVPLAATANDLADREAQSKHCSYVLFTHLQQGRSSAGIGGGFSKMKAILTGPSAFGAQPADTLTLQYRLLAVGATNPVNAESFSEKAAAGGQVPDHLVAQLSDAVVSAAQGSSSAGSASNPIGPAGSGGLFGHRSASRSIAANGGTSANMNCAQLAAMPNAPMTAEACEKFKGAQQAYGNAAADPAAARAGDDQMTCAQITAELKQQQFTAPDKTKVAETQATAGEAQAILKKEHENMLKMQARDQAATAAASATDTATELATGGLVRGRALQATEKVLDEEHRANNERALREDTPTFSKLNGQTADLGTDFASQLESNPRLARLMQLADSKHCKGGG